MKLSINMPKVGRGRLTGAVALSGAATTLFLAPGLLGWPGAALSPMLVTVGVLGPAGIGALTLTLTEQRVAKDLKPVRRRPLPEHDQAGVR